MLQVALPPAPTAGGVGYQVDLLATALTRRGHHVTVFAVDAPATPRTYHCEQVMAPRGRRRRILGVGRSFAALDLSSFDLVHAHGDDWLFGRRRRARTFHGTALMEARTATRWRRRGSQLCYYALEWVSSANPYSVAVSESTRRYLPLVRASIPCAFDPGIFTPGSARTAHPSILFVAGTLKGRKRGALLLSAFDEIRAELPEATLTIVSRDRVERPGVSYRSNLDATTLSGLYRSHWLLCSTSSYEGFGVPYVEALASGLPVVTTPNDGALEVLRGGELGVVCRPEELAQEIVGLMRDDTRREELSRLGAEAAHSYSVDVVAAQYEELYERLAAEAL